MNYHIDLQHATSLPNPIADDLIYHWVELTLAQCVTVAELTVRFVSPLEMTALNSTYRNQNKPTNVLAFPSEIPQEVSLDYPFLGDVIICSEVLFEESQALNCSLVAHWAHIIIHGVLHLLGYDHINSEDETIMQHLEIKLLAELGFANPYLIDQRNQSSD